MIRILVIGDLHGELPDIKVDRYDAIIAPGDFLGSDISKYYAKFFKLKKGNPDLEFDNVCPRWKQRYLGFVAKRKGKKVLKHLNSIGKRVFLVRGNWDIKDDRKWERIVGKYKNLIDVENRIAKFKGVEFLGHAKTSSPEDLEDDKENIKLLRKLDKLAGKSRRPLILITHDVPYKTKLDRIYSPGSYVHNKHYGSKIAREIIDKHQPLLCVGGHIHEGFGKTRLKRTMCINAGHGKDVNTVVEIDEKKGKVRSIEFLGENKA